MLLFVETIDKGSAQGFVPQAHLDPVLLTSLAFKSLSPTEKFLQRRARASCYNLHMQTASHPAAMEQDCEQISDLLLRYQGTSRCQRCNG